MYFKVGILLVVAVTIAVVVAIAADNMRPPPRTATVQKHGAATTTTTREKQLDGNTVRREAGNALREQRSKVVHGAGAAALPSYVQKVRAAPKKKKKAAAAAAANAQTASVAVDVLADTSKTSKSVLDQRVSLNLNEVPLRQFAEKLQTAIGKPVHFDMKSIQYSDISLDVPVTRNLAAVTVRQALRQILTPLELSYIERESHILITIPDTANAAQTTVVYPVRDLLDEKKGTPEEFAALIKTITGSVNPVSWSSVGGSNTIQGFAPSSSLIITASAEMHESITGLLAALRKTRDLQGRK